MKRSRFVGAMIAVLIMVMMATCAWASVIRVKTDGNNANNGSTWALAKQTLPGAFAAAVAGDEIWVKMGTYTSKGTIPGGVGVYGGFAGWETQRDGRNWSEYVTIVDGTGYFYVNDPNGTAVFDGFTVSGGSYYVGAAMLVSGSPTISHNNFLNNHAVYTGGAINCGGGTAKIINNYFYSNSAGYDGGAICCGVNSTAIITNNHFLGNSALRGGAIFMSSTSAPIISNNASEVDNCSFWADTGALPELHHNALLYFGYIGDPYTGLEPGEGDIPFQPASDPSRSVCVDAGWNDAPGVPDVDMTGRTRIWNTVDIGTTEVEIAYVSSTADVVGPAGDDSDSGFDWDSAKLTIQAAVDSVTSPAYIRVKNGTYQETITVPAGVNLEGGYFGYEMWRNWHRWPTVVDADYQGTAIDVEGTVEDTQSIIDGFRVIHGWSNTPDTDGAIEAHWCSPKIQHCILKDNSCTGILVEGDYGSNVANIISNICWMSSGDGIRIYGCNTDSAVCNNTINGTNGSGISLYDHAHPMVANNIVSADISYGVYADGYSYPSSMYNNDIWSCADSYSDWFDNNPSVIATDISADPQYDLSYPDELHIKSSSPCRDGGSTNYYSSYDIDGQECDWNLLPDIGADECHIYYVDSSKSDIWRGDSWYDAKSSINSVIEQISTDWGTGKFYADPIEIWVKAGIYTGTVDVPCDARIYGGFAGDETARSQRNWNTNNAILDGDDAGSTVTLRNDNNVLDGFSITGGYSEMGTGEAGVLVSGCSATVVHNKVYGNDADGIRAWGYYTQTPATIQNNIVYDNTYSGICVAGCDSNQRLVNNTIVGNNIGIYMADHAHPIVANNIIDNNEVGIDADAYSQPNTIFLNCLYGNTVDYGSNINYWLIGYDIFVNPLFASGSYHLTSTSPCIGAGSTQYMAPDDYDGTTRVSPSDIGADEYNQ